MIPAEPVSSLCRSMVMSTAISSTLTYSRCYSLLLLPIGMFLFCYSFADEKKNLLSLNVSECPAVDHLCESSNTERGPHAATSHHRHKCIRSLGLFSPVTIEIIL